MKLLLLQTTTTNISCLLCLLSLPVWLVAAQSIASQAYTPVAGPCPEGFSLVRMAGQPGNQTLSKSEAAYVQARRSQVIPQAWKEFLANVVATNVTLPPYAYYILNGSNSNSGVSGPNFAIATSGGGYRAATFGAGVLNALDGRNASSSRAGLGGLLQAATYVAGLSGGSWLLTSLAQANFPTIQELVFGYPNPTVANNSWGGWNSNFSILAPSNNPVEDAKYLKDLLDELKGKYDAGYPVTFSDYWSRSLARHFVNGTFPLNFYDESYLHGAGILWSAVAEIASFVSYAMPFFIVVTDIFATKQDKSAIIEGDFIPLKNPIIEITVFETGSFDPMLSAFVPTKYLGTVNDTVCITNYDQLALVAGTSSSLFNTQNLSSTHAKEIALLTSLLPETGIPLDVASWPNSFYGVAPETFISSSEPNLYCVDGFEDGENVPLQPLLAGPRGVDVILAVDASGNVNNFANGSSLIATQERVQRLSPAYSFPAVPTSAGEFIAQGLTTRPTFFGCNTTGPNDTTPLLIYLANGGPPHNGEAPVTNIPTLELSLSASKAQAILDQTFIIATQGYPANSSMKTDPEWPACLACAIVDRTRERIGETRSGVCESCFARYCWSGSTLSVSQNSGGKESVQGPHGVKWLYGLIVAVGVLALI